MTPVKRPHRRRLDEFLVDRGLVESRSRARALVLAGRVTVDGVTTSRAGAAVGDDAKVTLVAPPRFVSRGGEKLEYALESFQLDLTGMVAADVGASTGGFTDCLLQAGVPMVYAIDVGYGQLALKIRENPRVVVMDRTNVRYIERLPCPVDLVTIDVSFISLRLVLPAVVRWLTASSICVALIKPQFEAGRSDVGKGGVVRDPNVHERVIRDVAATARSVDLCLSNLVRSPLRGPAGNVEFLALLTRESSEPAFDLEQAINRVVS